MKNGIQKTFLHTSTHKNVSIYRHSYSKEKQLSLTEVPIFVKILSFILPLMVTNLLQVLYNAADMIVVSFSREANAVGAIGTTSSFINLIVNIFMGFAMGVNVIVARYLGAKNDVKVSRAIHTSLIMSLIFGIASGIVGLFISRPVLSLMGAEGNLLDLAVRIPSFILRAFRLFRQQTTLSLYSVRRVTQKRPLSFLPLRVL